MDYTTLQIVKAAMRAQEVTDDAILNRAITSASRAIDRKCTGVPDNDAVDYFKSETKTAEMLNGLVNGDGVVICRPRKPLVTSVTSLEYRTKITNAWVSIVPANCWIQGYRIEATPATAEYEHARCQVRITYTGGLSATVAALPADLVEAATILAVRFYKEAQSGLQDIIGIAEMGVSVYTKAWPVRVLEMLQPFVRATGWREIG